MKKQKYESNYNVREILFDCFALVKGFGSALSCIVWLFLGDMILSSVLYLNDRISLNITVYPIIPYWIYFIYFVSVWTIYSAFDMMDYRNKKGGYNEKTTNKD